MENRELANVWEKVGLPVLVFPAGSIRSIYCNSLASALCGGDLFAALPPNDARHLQDALLGRSDPPFFCRLGQEVYSAVLIPYEEYAVCLLHQVTGYYNRTQNALDEAIMASKAKTNFLSEMSHDIRTPMGAIVGLTEIALNHNNSPLKIQECLEKIKVASGHMMSLLNEVLDMSRIESGRISLQAEKTNVADLLHEILIVARPQADAGQLKFSLEMGPVYAENLMLDAVRLKQVCLNLLSNAIKYTPAGGWVDFYFAIEPKDPGQVLMTMRVKDNGIGMSREFLTKVFSPFEREEKNSVNKIQGTGLGMAITKNLVELMNGSIQVESETGKGSCFSVEIPFSSTGDAVYDELAGQRVLLLDPKEKRARQAIVMLTQLRIETDWAQSAGEVMEFINDADLSGEEYYAFLTVEKIEGAEMTLLLPDIRRRLGDKPMLLLTDNDWSQIEYIFTRSGIDSFIPLPLFKSRLAAGLFSRGNTNDPTVPEVHSSQGSLTGCRLLLAEDNELNREIAQELLEESGAIIECATDGLEALTMFQESAPQYYQVILMDVQMPKMNGLDATRNIRLLDRPDAGTIPIIAMTANAFVEDMKNSLDAGMNAHISKPLDMDKVFSTIEALLRGTTS